MSDTETTRQHDQINPGPVGERPVGERRGTGVPVGVTELGQALLVVGDQWNMLIVKAAFEHIRRFNDFRDALGVSDGVLASRLSDLVHDGVLATETYSAHPNRVEYLLTEKGRDLWPIFVATWWWERRWVREDSADSYRLIHHACDSEIMPEFGCATCGEVGITHRETAAVRRPEASFDQSNPRRRYRRSSIESCGEADAMHPELLKLLGDRWSVSILSGALLGLRRFGDFQSQLGISPHLLSERLAGFVDSRVLRHVPVKVGGKRFEYRLTPKGFDLMPSFLFTNEWSHRWFDHPDEQDLTMYHRASPEAEPHELIPAWFCDVCGKRLVREQIEFRVGAD